VNIRLTKLDDRRHVLEIERGGRSERVELETRSTLHHDLTHLAVEEAAGIDQGFFGALAAGRSLAELGAGVRDGAPEYVGPMLQVERAVVMLQQLTRRDEDPAELLARIRASLAHQNASPPSWLTLELVAAVRERLRRLLGQWRATPYGECLELRWGGDGSRSAGR